MLEERRICAYINILNLKEQLLDCNEKRVFEIINLIHDINFEDIKELNNQNLCYGMHAHPIADVNSFSNHIVISAPLKPMSEKLQEASSFEELLISDISFIEHILSKIITIYSRTLPLGLLIKGALTIGQLYHKESVVVGLALVNAQKQTKQNKQLNIEVSAQIVDILQKHYTKVSKASKALNYFDRFIVKENNTYIVNLR